MVDARVADAVKQHKQKATWREEDEKQYRRNSRDKTPLPAEQEGTKRDR